MRHGLAVAVCLWVALAGGCGNDDAGSRDDAASPAELAADSGAAGALERLATVETDAFGDRAECAEYEAIAGAPLRNLIERTGTLAEPPIRAPELTRAGRRVIARADSLASAREPDDAELARLHRELTALLHDLGEALGALARGVSTSPQDGLVELGTRLDNAVDNLETTLGTLRRLCSTSRDP